MAVALPIEQLDSWEIARTKINNSFQALSAQFLNSIPYIQDGYWYVNGENTGVPTSSGNLALRVNDGILQWKNADSGMAWANLLKLSDLRGDPWESGQIYGSNITDCETHLDEDRGITYLIIHLDDGTSRTVELFKWNDVYKNPVKQQQDQTLNVNNVSRTFFAKSTDTANAVNRTAVLINPDSWEASWEQYTPRAWDTVYVLFTTDCKVDNPTLNISWNGNRPIYLDNKQAEKEYFFIWQWTRVKFMYMWMNRWYTEHYSLAVDIYTDEWWRIVDAVRELKRTRMDVTEAELAQIKAQGLYDPYIYYHIIDS